MKYYCELWITKPDIFLIEADSVEDAEKKFVKIAEGKTHDGEMEVGQFIREVPDDFEIEAELGGRIK